MTQPVVGMICREGSLSGAHEVYARLGNLLDECVNHGTHVFSWCDSSTTTRSGHHFVTLLLLYRHVLEMVDGVSVLVREGAGEPCKPLLRSAFEGLLSIEFILAADTERRAIAYQVEHVWQRIYHHERIDPNTRAGAEFQALLDGDEIAKGVKLQPHDSAQAIDRLGPFLAKQGFREVSEEFERCKRRNKNGKKLPRWHELFDGPRSIRGLAERLGFAATYVELYGDWSRTVHGSGAMSMVVGREGVVRAIRHPASAQFATSFAASFALRSARKMIAFFDASKHTEHMQWYAREVREAYRAVAGGSMLSID